MFLVPLLVPLGGRGLWGSGATLSPAGSVATSPSAQLWLFELILAPKGPGFRAVAASQGE